MVAFCLISKDLILNKSCKMKKNIISHILVASLISVVIFTGCGPSTPREEDAKAEVKEAKNELNEAKRAATAEEWQAFKDESEVKIKNNEIRMAELKVKIKKSGKELDALYQNKVDALEQQNKAMKARIDTYEINRTNDWESFKREFNHDMDELGKAMKDLTVDNKK
jgi:hypothetical protein